MPQHRPIRVVCATRRKNGRASFNQVVLNNAPQPRGVLLVAIEPDEGIRLWMKPLLVLEPHTSAQHGGYSRNLQVNVDNPPDYLAEPVLIPKGDVDQTEEGLWQQILDAKTNTKNKLARELFGF